MTDILKPGYLRWDGLKYTTDPEVEIIGPIGPQGIQGLPGSAVSILSGDVNDSPDANVVNGLTHVIGNIIVTNRSAPITTTDGTTAIDLISYDTPLGYKITSHFYIDGYILGGVNDGYTYAAEYVIATKNLAGTVAAITPTVPTNQLVLIDESGGAIVGISGAISLGPTLTIRIKGAASTTIKWYVRMDQNITPLA